MADVIHKNEDLSELSEAEQLELVMRESKIDALSPEEQVKLTRAGWLLETAKKSS